MRFGFSAKRKIAEKMRKVEREDLESRMNSGFPRKFDSAPALEPHPERQTFLLPRTH
jgi:hypothetical protein